jgi:hypothetical protein
MEYYENNLINSEFIIDPFIHRKYKLFSDQLCNDLIENFISIKNYMTKSSGISQSRFMICITGDTINGLNYGNYSFLKEINPINNILLEYNNVILPNLNKVYGFNGNIKYQINLVYDTKNYEIGPHTDSYNRKITNIVYLVPVNDYGKNIGVSLYKDLINRHQHKWEKTHYSFDNFEKIDQVSYYPGSSVDFKVSKNSFHGVKSIEYKCNRMSIQSIIWK